jgi:hypothetical protein
MGWLDKLLGRGESQAEQIAEAEERGIDSEADAMEEDATSARDQITDIGRDPRR